MEICRALGKLQQTAYNVCHIINAALGSTNDNSYEEVDIRK